MTTQAIGSPSTLSAPSKGASNAPAPASTGGFADHLHAARLSGAPAAQERGPAQQTPPEPGRGDAPGKNPAPPGTAARSADAGAERPGKQRDSATASGDVSAKTTSQSQVAADASTPQAADTATPLGAEAVAEAVAGDAAAGDKDTDDSEQSAAALVGAMLALVGPAVGKVLSLGAAGLPATSAKSVTTDAGAAALPQGGDAASLTVTNGAAPPAIPAQWFAGNNLPPGQKDARDAAGADGVPSLALSAAPPAAPALPLSPPMLAPAGAQAFAQELGQQVTWFVDQGIKQARIRLHPEELGSLDLKISVNHGRVDVVFHAQHPGAVAAVQQSLPQLDQMLAQHGLSLGNTEVGQHDRGDQSGHAGRGDSLSEVDEVHGAGLVTPVSQLGLLDAFA